MARRRRSKVNPLVILIVMIIIAAAAFAAVYAININKVTFQKIEIETIEHIAKGETATVNYQLVFDISGNIPKWIEQNAVKAQSKKLKLDADTFSNDLLNVSIQAPDKNGMGTVTLTAKGDGNASYYVHCDSENYKQELVCGVLKPEAVIAKETVFVAKGESVNLEAAVFPKYADEQLTYEIANDFIAQVDSHGNVTFMSTGETTVKTITVNGLVAETKIVAAIVAEDFSFTNKSVTCSKGSIIKPGYSTVPSYVTYGSDVYLYSENDSVVKYDASKGYFIATGSGETDIVGVFNSENVLTDRIHVVVMGADVNEVVTSYDPSFIPAARVDEKLTCKQDGYTRLSVKNILQKPELPNGCEITSTTIALNYLGYKVDKVTMADVYLDCEKPYSEVDPEKAYMGNPHNTGWYCYPPVIVEAVNEYLDAHNETGHRATDISGASYEELTSLIDKGTPVIFWATLYFNQPWHWTKFTLPNGELPYYNLHCLVMTGYDADYVYIADPLGLNTKISTDKFVDIFQVMGSRAVKID